MARRLTAEQARKLKAKASDGKPVGLREVKAARPPQEAPVAPEPKPQADGMPDLVEAIRSVHAGESVLHPVIARKVIERVVQPSAPGPPQESPEHLTERELDVLRLAARGQSNKDIALELYLSTRTVQTHLSTVFAKMEVGSRTEAVVQALQRGWLTLEDIFPEEDR